MDTKDIKAVAEKALTSHIFKNLENFFDWWYDGYNQEFTFKDTLDKKAEIELDGTDNTGIWLNAEWDDAEYNGSDIKLYGLWIKVVELDEDGNEVDKVEFEYTKFAA